MSDMFTEEDVERSGVNPVVKDLGWANGWKDDPLEYQICRKARHVLIERTIGNCAHEYRCDICGLKWYEDSSG